MSPDYQIAYVNDRRRLAALSGTLASSSVVALDIETASWWDPRAERVSLVQLAYRDAGRVRVAVVDALSIPDPAELRAPLESGDIVKAIHNAAFDASRIERHFGLRVSPIHDTMLSARRGGERGCSLKAQAGKHLGLSLDKGEQQGDWGARPLHPRQIAYAALDAAATLLLYENQIGRGLRGDYRPRAKVAEVQVDLPLDAAPYGGAEAPVVTTVEPASRHADADLSGATLALLGVIVELPSRYGPERLAASVGEDRVGLAGWIVDRVLGAAVEVDEATAKEAIAILCGRGLVRLTTERRLEANPIGREMWDRRKPV